MQLSSVIDDKLDAQDSGTFIVHLQSQPAEVQFEHCEIMHGAVQDFLHASGLAPVPLGPVFTTENRCESGHIQEFSGPVDQPLIDLVELTAAFEQQVAAVFKLRRTVGISKLGALLCFAS